MTAAATPELKDVTRLSASAISLPYRPRPRRVRALISRVTGAVLISVSLVVVVGWLLGVRSVTAITADWASMKMNTALCFLLLGTTFWLPGGAKDPRTPRLVGRICAGIATTIAALTVAEYLFDVNLQIDQLFFEHPARGAEFPGRMAYGTAIAMLLSSLAAVLIDWRTGQGSRPSLILAMIVGTVGLAAMIGYLYDSTSLYSVFAFSSMSLPTSLLFVCASIGILGVHPDRGPFGILASDGRGSRLARAILPFGIGLPILIGWLRLQGQRAGYYDFEFGMALFATASVLVFVTLIWLTATSLNREEVLKRRADEALEHEAIRRRILFEQASDGIFVLGPDHKIVEANKSLAEMIGYSLQEMATLHPWDWISDEKTREFVAGGWASMESNRATFESQLRGVDGATIDAEVSCTMAEFDDQKFLFFVCRNITQRKLSQRALHTSEQRFRRALANIPDVVVIYDADLRIQYINSATRTVTGQAAESFIGKRDEEIFPPSVTNTYMPTLRKAFLNRQIAAAEADIDLPGAGVRSLRITCVPLLDQNGDVHEVLGITRDLTERKKAEEAIRASEAKHRNLIEQAADGIFISDADGNFELVNSRCCELLGYREQELLGLNGRVTFLNEETSVNTSRLRELRAGGDLRYERMLRRKDGSVFPAEVSVKLLESGSTQVIFHDITERHEQDKKINRLHRIQAMLSGINSAIVRIRNRPELLQETCRIAVEEGKFCVGWIGTVDHKDSRLQMVAQSGFCESDSKPMLNQPAQLVPEGPAEFAILQQRPVFDNNIDRAPAATPIRQIASRLGARSVIALPLIVENETYGIVVLYAQEENFFDDEEINLLRELAEDVSFGLEYIAKEEKVDYLAYYDTLTGLPNRSLFFYRLSRQLQEATNESLNTILSLVDIDRFRMINDTYGRHEGDALIAAIAKRISNSVQDTDTVARIGSNTFAVAVNQKWDAAETAHTLEGRSHAVFDDTFRVGREDIRVSATTGVAAFPSDASSPEVLLANAEAALRSAKSTNKRYLLYSPDMNAQVAESMRLENKVRAALANDELTLWYQPKVCAETGRLRGLEALMRWHDPDTGKLVPPDKFIPIMEHTGLILEAGEWALWQVARDCALWKKQGLKPPHMAVNVSPIQLEQKNFVDSVVKAHRAITATGAALDLEITESVIMEQVDKIIPKLQTLHDLGIRISIDDFGTGYSSLQYIARLPIDALKIDRSFVMGLGESAESMAIVRSVISLAKALQLIVVAEGVETGEQAVMLRELQCDELQGYHFGRPLPPDETPDVVKALS